MKGESSHTTNAVSVTPIDGWLRQQRETLPEIAQECRDKLAKIDADGAAIREALQTVERVLAAIGPTDSGKVNNRAKVPPPAPEPTEATPPEKQP